MSLQAVLTLDEAAESARAQGLILHRRHDLVEICLRGLIPAEKRSGNWLITSETLRALVRRLLGLSRTQRRALYKKGEILVDLDIDGGSLPADLLVGYPEIMEFSQRVLGWSPAKITLSNNLPSLKHRRPSQRAILTTHQAVKVLVQTIWTNKLRLAGIARPQPNEDPAQILLGVAQLLVGKHPGAQVTPETIEVLRRSLEAAIREVATQSPKESYQQEGGAHANAGQIR